MPLIEILFVAGLLLAFAVMFYLFYRASTKPVALSVRSLEEEEVPYDPRPPLKIASMYEYMQRCYGAPFLIVIPVVLIYYTFSIKDGRAPFVFQLYLFSAVQIYFITDFLLHRNAYKGRKLVTAESDPQHYWSIVRFLLFCFFGMIASYIVLFGLMELLWAWFPKHWWGNKLSSASAVLSACLPKSEGKSANDTFRVCD